MRNIGSIEGNKPAADNTGVWAYGSRVKFTAKPHSDLDMVAFASKEQSQAVANLREAFEESYLPFKVGLFVWDEVPEGFHRNIEGERVVVQEMKKRCKFLEGWQETIIGEFCPFSYGKNLPKKARDSLGEVPVFGSNGVVGHHSKPLIQDRGIIIGRKGTVGTVTFSSVPFWPIDTTFYISEDSHRDLRYTFYLLKSLRMEHMNADSAVPGLNRNAAHARKITIPPLPEQKAIAHILGSLDDKIELNRRMNETLEAMAQALFKSWFVDFDPVIDNALATGNAIPDELKEKAAIRQGLSDEKKSLPDDIRRLFPSEFAYTEEMGWIPKGWEILSVGKVSSCFDNRRIPLSRKQRECKQPGAIPYYGATSIMDYINEYIFNDIFLLIGEDGSVVKEDGSPFTQYIWGQTWVNNHAHVLQGAFGISTEHLMLFLQSQNIRSYTTGAVQLKINQKNMNSIPFLFAANRINKSFTSIIDPLYERIRKLSESNKKLYKIQDALLPRLLSGEILMQKSDKPLEEAK